MKVNLDGTKEQIEVTEIVEGSLHPSWQSPIVIDYSMRDTYDYLAELIDTESDNGVEKVLGEACFKLPELITSKGELIFKELKCHGIIEAMDQDEHQLQEPKNPILGIIGIEDKDGELDALEFSLNVYNLP